ncbi:WD repeat-containing protein 76-like [Littorina saxatilis]|uniref:WD repeat-containing protein 76-like n=1 Tax=Littorina saxatilis TaxID=31220 RepID=UPI0038B5B047
MRGTRSRTQRQPLQMIAAPNSDRKIKNETASKRQPEKEGSQVTALKDFKKEPKANAMLEVKPALHNADITSKVSKQKDASLVRERSSRAAVSCASSESSPAKSRKRPLSPVKAQPEIKALKVEAASEEDQVSDSEEEELDYETMRQRNLRDNEAFFSSLGIDKAKEQLQRSVKKYPKPSQRREPKKKVILPVRKSLRIQRIDPTGAALPPTPEPEPIVYERPRVPEGPVDMLDAIESETCDHSPLATSLVNFKAQSCRYKPLTSDLSCFVSSMKKMRITTKAKACKDRLMSVAVHPTTDKVLAMAGDKWGRLGFWNISAHNQEQSVVVYRPHSRPIGHIAVRPMDPLKVYTCGYDATLRCGDFETGVFDELYSVPEDEDDLFRNFDFISPTSLLLAQFRGDVALLDTRTPKQKAEKLFYVCDHYLRTVSVHPTNTNYFCTAGSDGNVCVWDLRKAGGKGSRPLAALTHSKGVASAYFSPVSGKYILSCSSEDTVNVFSSPTLSDKTERKTIRHNNHTGRWLTPFRAVWHPAREDVFFVGSMKSPRRIEAFGVDGRLLHEFDGEVLASVCSVLQFHPSRNILVGGNSSGYIFPFM